jgi:hypothetical protein
MKYWAVGLWRKRISRTSNDCAHPIATTPNNFQEGVKGVRTCVLKGNELKRNGALKGKESLKRRPYIMLSSGKGITNIC